MPATQITSFYGDVNSGKPPFPTIYRGLLSVVSPFAGLAGKTVSLQIFGNNAWSDTGVSAVTDNNGVFMITIVWDPAFMPPGTYRIRASFAGDGTNAASVSGEVTVTMTNGGGGISPVVLLGSLAIAVGAVILLSRR